MGWKALQAVRYRSTCDRVELTLPPVLLHKLLLSIRPLKKLHMRSEGVKRDRPLPAGWVAVLPAESSVWQLCQGDMDGLAVFLDPSIVARVAESFGFDPNRMVVPPLDGFNSPELSSTMLAVDAKISRPRVPAASAHRLASG